MWVTGVGAVSAAGDGGDALLRLLLDGRSAVVPVPELSGLGAGRAPTPRRKAHARHLDRSAGLFMAAGDEAWQTAGLAAEPPAPERTMLIEGSSLGPMADLLRWHEGRVTEAEPGLPRPSVLVRFMTGAGGAALAQAHGIRGPVVHLSVGSVSAMAAIGEGYRKILNGEADLVIAGGAECPLHPDIVASFHAAGILAPCDGGVPACRPFDARRAGTVLGEGAGVVILEAEEHARRRGAAPRAVVKGFGLVCEAHSFTAPDPTGAGVSAAVRQALGALDTNQIGWIKTHGTGTRANDLAECRGLAAVFGGGLVRARLTSLKPALGHCLGASGAVEAVGAVLSLEVGAVPPTVNTEQIDPELPPCTVATRPECSTTGAVLLLAESFGGRCAALVLERA